MMIDFFMNGRTVRYFDFCYCIRIEILTCG